MFSIWSRKVEDTQFSCKFTERVCHFVSWTSGLFHAECKLIHDHVTDNIYLTKKHKLSQITEKVSFQSINGSPAKAPIRSVRMQFAKLLRLQFTFRACQKAQYCTLTWDKLKFRHLWISVRYLSQQRVPFLHRWQNSVIYKRMLWIMIKGQISVSVHLQTAWINRIVFEKINKATKRQNLGKRSYV